MAYDWSEQYAIRASSAKQSGAGLGTLRAEYVHRYNQLLEREKQPHSDFFVNSSEDFEDGLDFSKDRPADLSQYDQYFEWDEAEYMKLRFTAARHYASRGHWTDAYAYVLRTCPDNIPQHEDTYNRNAQVWHYTDARINEFIQEIERILEVQDRQMSEGSHFGPPRESLIPLDIPLGHHLQLEVPRGKGKSLGNGCSLLLLSTWFLGQDQHLQLSWTLHRPAPDPLLRPVDGHYGQKGWYPRRVLQCVWWRWPRNGYSIIRVLLVVL